MKMTAANKTRIIAIGDIHGCYYTLRELLKKLNINYETDFLVFLGDYIDRGSWPLKTIKYLRTISKKHPDSIVCLKGNHEDMCYRYYYNEPYSKIWLQNGARITLEDFSMISSDTISKYLGWMKSLPERFQIDQYRFCHSGNFKDIIEDDISLSLWDRNWTRLGFDSSDNGFFVIFGHTPDYKIRLVDHNHLCIDTSCVFGGSLTAACIEVDSENISYKSVKQHQLDR